MIPVAIALQTIAAFNLACAGTLRTGPIGLALPEQEGEPFTITYRINADDRRWCSDECETVEPIAAIVQGLILLRDRHEASGSHTITITPANARFVDTLIEGNRATLRSGQCEPRDFTGFPQPRRQP